MKFNCTLLSSLVPQCIVHVSGEFSNLKLLCLMRVCGMMTVSFVICRYWLPEGPSNTLTVHVMDHLGLGDALWSTPGIPSAGWEVAEVTVSSPENFFVRHFLLLENVKSMKFSKQWTV